VSCNYHITTLLTKDFDEIHYTTAHLELNDSHVTKYDFLIQDGGRPRIGFRPLTGLHGLPVCPLVLGEQTNVGSGVRSKAAGLEAISTTTVAHGLTDSGLRHSDYRLEPATMTYDTHIGLFIVSLFTN